MKCGDCLEFNKGLPLKPGQKLGVCSAIVHDKDQLSKRYYRQVDQEACWKVSKTTMPKLWWPLMLGHTVSQRYCVVCGRAYPLNQHHVVKRSQGQLYRGGRVVKKPTLTLCGSGNTSGCHGKAHSGRLHFKYEDGEWLYLETEPMKYQDALELEGWRPIHEDA